MKAKKELAEFRKEKKGLVLRESRGGQEKKLKRGESKKGCIPSST